MHQALIILTVLKVEGVTEFMRGLLDDSLKEEILLAAWRNTAGQTVRGNNTAGAPQLCLPIYMGKDRNEEIFVRQCDDLQYILWDILRQFLKYRCRVKLLPVGIPGKIDRVDQRLDTAWQLERSWDHGFNGTKNISVEITNRGN